MAPECTKVNKQPAERINEKHKVMKYIEQNMKEKDQY